MPFGTLDGVGIGSKAELADAAPVIFPDVAWLGRVVNAMGEPIDGGPPLPIGRVPHLLRGSPPPAHQRRRVGGKLDLGVRALNTLLTCCRGSQFLLPFAACRASVIATPYFVEPDRPNQDEGFIFLISRIVEGAKDTVGHKSSGTEHVLVVPCP